MHPSRLYIAILVCAVALVSTRACAQLPKAPKWKPGGLDGKVVKWMEKVNDEQYEGV